MRSRRLPGERKHGDPTTGSRRPPPPPEPAPLPAEVYFDAQSRKREEAIHAVPEEGVMAEDTSDTGPTFQSITQTYGARTVAAGGIFLQVSVGLLMLPRIVNAAETLLVNPTQLMVLAAIGIVEVTMAGWGFWTRSWFGAVTSLILGIVWWGYLLVQIF